MHQGTGNIKTPTARAASFHSLEIRQACNSNCTSFFDPHFYELEGCGTCPPASDDESRHVGESNMYSKRQTAPVDFPERQEFKNPPAQTGRKFVVHIRLTILLNTFCKVKSCWVPEPVFIWKDFATRPQNAIQVFLRELHSCLCSFSDQLR